MHALDSVLAASLLGVIASGCLPVSDFGYTGTTAESSSVNSGTTMASGTVDVSTGVPSSTTTAPAPTSGDPTCGAFICEGDLPPGQCDVWAQQCPEGEKCVPVTTDGEGTYGTARCVPVNGTDVAGDACTAESVADGLDSCAKGHICLGVDKDGNGTCIAQCAGTPNAPICAKNSACVDSGNGFINLCLPDCDPLLQDCADGFACYPLNDRFACALDASGDTGKANDLCEFITVCAPGLLCAGPEFVGAGCPPGSMGCCTPFCKFPDGACPNPDQQCVQWYDPAMLPADDPQLLIGFCGVPQ
jgi:hypothetical protein